MINKHIGKPEYKPLISSITYALPVIAVAMLMAPVNILQGIYAKYHGLALVDIATVVLMARLLDAVTDPLIGYYADLYNQKHGHRKPFIVCGGLMLVISSYFLYVPPVSVDIGYFAFWFILLYLAFTLFEIPHLAWGSDLAHSSEAKTQLFSFRGFAGYAGLVIFYSMPLLPIFSSSEITPATLKVSTIVAGVLMMLLIWRSIKYPSRVMKADSEYSAGSKDRKKDQQDMVCDSCLFKRRVASVRQLFGDVINNRPFLVFLGALILTLLGAMLWYATIFLYVDVYLGKGESFAQIFLLSFVVGLFATPVWYRLIIMYGKKTMWIFTTLLVMVSYFYTSTLTPEDTSFRQLVLLKVLNTLGFTCQGVVAYALLSEIIDYDTLKSGLQRSGTYYSLNMFLSKTIVAMGSALGLAIVGFLGFDATAVVQTDSAIHGLMLVMCWLPLAFSAMGGFFVMKIPINERRHRIILRALKRKREC